MNVPQTVDEVLKAQRTFHQALMESDARTLSVLLADDLMYIHHQGIDDTKSSLIIGIQTGLYAYESVRRLRGDTTMYGAGLAVSVGTVELVPTRTPDSAVVLNEGLVWRLRNEHWRLTSGITTAAVDDDAHVR